MDDVNHKAIIEAQTVEDAMWGYRDTHGKWTSGLVQRMTAVEGRINLLLGLVTLALGKSVWPDLVGLLVKTATVAAAATGHIK